MLYIGKQKECTMFVKLCNEQNRFPAEARQIGNMMFLNLFHEWNFVLFFVVLFLYVEFLIWFGNPNGFWHLIRYHPEDYFVIWKPVYDTRRPRGQRRSLTVAFSALRFTIGPLGNERPNKWIHQSVCVLLSVFIWDAVRPRRAQSAGTQRKGMPLLAGLMNGWHIVAWQRRMWQPPSHKRGAVFNYQREIMWCWPPQHQI